MFGIGSKKRNNAEHGNDDSSSSSTLKVLTVGNHPNLILYSWRFSLANSFDLTYVGEEMVAKMAGHGNSHTTGSSTPLSATSTQSFNTIQSVVKSSAEHIIDIQFEDTDAFHQFDTSKIDKFATIDDLVGYYKTIPQVGLTTPDHDTFKQDSFLKKLPFDIVIIGSDSLQDLSYISSKLEYDLIISNKTKIFVESSGFVNLENFVSLSLPSATMSTTTSNNSDKTIKSKKMNKNDSGTTIPHEVKVLSIVSECDFRKKNDLQFVKKKAPDNVYIGISLKTFEKKYSKENNDMLTTLAKLFNKLFHDLPNFKVSTCKLNPQDFIMKQWQLAIPMIIFDCLMILFDIDSVEKLNEQILTKPLITGLLTELQTIIKESLNINKLPDTYNEDVFSKNWLNLYNNDNSDEYEIPKLLYNFQFKKSSLNIDLMLLQPILMADDYNIKTPYMEFLYSMIIQFDKINHNDSKWFINKKDYKTNLDSLQKKIFSLENRQHLELDRLTKGKMSVDNELKVMEKETQNLKLQIENLMNENTSMKLQLKEQVDILQNHLNSVVMENNNLKMQLLQFNNINYAARLHNSGVNTVQKNEQLQEPVGNMAQERVEETINKSADASAVESAVGSTVESAAESEYFTDARSTVLANDVEPDVMAEIKEFSTYGIYYGTPQSQKQQSPVKARVKGDQVVDDKINTSTAATITDEQTEHQTIVSNSAGLGDSQQLFTEEELGDESLRNLKQKELELRRRELLLEQREKVLGSGTAIQYGGPQFPVNQNMFPMPPPQQFPPAQRQRSYGNIQQHMQMQQQQAPQQMQPQAQPQMQPQAPPQMQPQGRTLSGGRIHTPPVSGYNSSNFPQQQQPVTHQQQSYTPPNMAPHLQQPIRVSSAPQVYHPQYIKTSRKNRQSVLPSALKIDINGANIGTTTSVNTQSNQILNTNTVLPSQGAPAAMFMQPHSQQANGKYGVLHQPNTMRQNSITTASTSFNLNNNVLQGINTSSRNVSGGSSNLRNASSSYELRSQQQQYQSVPGIAGATVTPTATTPMTTPSPMPATGLKNQEKFVPSATKSLDNETNKTQGFVPVQTQTNQATVLPAENADVSGDSLGELPTTKSSSSKKQKKLSKFFGKSK